MKRPVHAWMFVVSMLLAVMAIPGAALAEGSGMYAGLGIGQSEVDRPGEMYADFDDKDTAVKLFVGYAVNKGFSVELGYVDLGSYVLKFDPLDPTVSIKQEATALYLAGIGSVPLSDRIALIAKIGLAKWDSDFTENDGGGGVATGSGSGLDTLFGIGFQFDLKPVVLRVEYEQYQDIGDGTSATPVFGPGKYDGTDIDVFGLSVAFRF